MQIKQFSVQRRGRAFGLRGSMTVLALSAAMMLGTGCDRDQVSHATTAKPAPDSGGMAPGQAPMAPPMGSMPPGQLPAPPQPAPAGALKWSLPKGWTEVQGGGPMRFATLTPAGPGKAEVSVIVLPGPAGGELANVNRWRGQIGLGPIEETALASARKVVKSKAGAVNLYDFTSEGQLRSRMVTAMLSTPDGNTWFLKLLGDADPVGKARPDFLRLLEALHLD